MQIDDLLKLIYGDTSHLPHCGVCRRPLAYGEIDGKKFVYCKHCAELAEEERKREENK